ncbi:unnamed protein product, partial [Mesorhabditis spiculigera]
MDFVEIREGLYKKIVNEGEGTSTPAIGSTVYVHYVGRLEDGTIFDSSLDRPEAFQFTLGREQVIKGWDIGVATMKKGETCELKISPDLAYGVSGSPPKIPGGATLLFEVELLHWASEDISPDRDGSITRDTIVKGEDLANPNDTSEVDVHIVGEHDGSVFYDRELRYILGECSEVGLPEGVDRAIRRMCRGEKSVIHLKGTRFTYGAEPPSENFATNAPLSFTIFLRDYVKVPATWEMTSEQKLEASQEAKARGNDFLHERKYKLALNKYKRIEDLLEYERSSDPVVKARRDALLVAAYLNLALTYSKLNEELEAISACNKALELDPNNVKGLYRKGCAKLSFGDFEEALEIFKAVKRLEPQNTAAQQKILVCKQRIREHESSERRRFRSLFASTAQPEVQPTEDQSLEVGAQSEAVTQPGPLSQPDFAAQPDSAAQLEAADA